MLALQPSGSGPLEVPPFNIIKFPRGGAQRALAEEIHARTVTRMAGGGGNLGSPLAGVSVGSPLGTAQAVEAPVANWWEAGGATGCVAAYQPKGAASLAASYVNLANPGTFDAVPVDAPTFNTATGWMFNGTSDYLTTGITPDDGWSVLFQFTDLAPTGGGYAPFGSVNGGFVKRFSFQLYPDPDFYAGEHQGFEILSGQIFAGNLGFAGQQIYKNGTAQGSGMGTNSGTYRPIYIGCWNLDGSATDFTPYTLRAIVFYNNILSAPQMLAVQTAMAAL